MITRSDLGNNVLFVSHVWVDFDGLIPFVLNKFFNIDYAKSISVNYSEDLELESLQSGLYENVIYVDFTPSEICQKAIIEHNINCLILDHHIAVEEEMKEFCNNYSNAEYIFDNERCGTKIYYDWLIEQGYKGNEVSDYIVTLTDTYDLYKTKDPLFEEAEKCNRLLYSTGKYYIKDDRLKCFEFFINTMLWKMQNADHFFFNALETSKITEDIKKENELFESIIKNAPTEISTRKDSKGYYFIIFTCKSKISAVAHKMLEKYKKVDYCIVINDYDKENPKISLRSRDGFDLLQLNYAKGHEQACGISDAEIAPKTMKEFTEDLKSKKLYELGYKEN